MFGLAVIWTGEHDHCLARINYYKCNSYVRIWCL